MSNTYEYILPYKAEEIKNILDKFQNFSDISGSGNSPYIGDNGNWFEWSEEAKDYVDTGVQAQGEDGVSGLPTILKVDGNGWESNLPAYTEVRIGQPTAYINILGFDYNIEKVGNDMWAITFTTEHVEGVACTVYVPDYVEWAVAEPVFTVGYTYYLSFIPFGEKILGVWVAKELTASE